jgi:hypothetical protein
MNFSILDLASLHLFQTVSPAVLPPRQEFCVLSKAEPRSDASVATWYCHLQNFFVPLAKSNRNLPGIGRAFPPISDTTELLPYRLPPFFIITNNPLIKSLINSIIPLMVCLKVK